MYTVETADGLYLDFGCSWIHGINGSSDGMVASNPIWDIAVAAGSETGSTGSPDNLVARNSAVSIIPKLDTTCKSMTMRG